MSNAVFRVLVVVGLIAVRRRRAVVPGVVHVVAVLGAVAVWLAYIVGVELSVANPVVHRELDRIFDAVLPLLGGVDEEQAAERPPRLTAQVRARLLIDDHDPLAGAGESDQQGADLPGLLHDERDQGAADPERLAVWIPLGFFAYTAWHFVKTISSKPVEPDPHTGPGEEQQYGRRGPFRKDCLSGQGVDV